MHLLEDSFAPAALKLRKIVKIKLDPLQICACIFFMASFIQR